MILTLWRNRSDRCRLSVVCCQSQELPRTTGHGPRTSARGFTLVEMLVAMAITLVMMGAVVTLFANVSNSVRNRRAVVEMSGQLRHVRNVLQRDLQGATCPGLVWQRPEENQGYIEIIEGPDREGQATKLIDKVWPPTELNPEIDHATSILPTSNLPVVTPPAAALGGAWVTDGAGLGDADDILMLTVRNEHEPFVGRVPESDNATDDSNTRVRPNDTRANPFGNWDSATIESPLAEVVWFSVENPGYTYDPTIGPGAANVEPSADGFFGEPGMRTVYRRTLLIAPWINPYRFVDTDGTIDDTFQINGSGPTFTAKPGLVRILPGSIDRDEVHEALAALVAFQEAYDLSVRLEFDPLLDAPDGRWKLVANTLGDLTKRENRYEHHFYRPDATNPNREFPFAAASFGSGYMGATDPVEFVPDPDVGRPSGATDARATARINAALGNAVTEYTIDPLNLVDTQNRRYFVRPFAYVDGDSTTVATARAMLNDDGEVVRVVHGLVPLSGDRRGEDVMLTDVLGFDLRVYDPGAPLFGHVETKTMIVPTDPAWLGYPPTFAGAYMHRDNMDDGSGAVGNNNNSGSVQFPFVGQGAYVDLGYGYDPRLPAADRQLPEPVYPPPPSPLASSLKAWFFRARALRDAYDVPLAPGYSVYDTWSFHYENNGLNEDDDEINGTTSVWQRSDNDAVGSEDDIPQIDEGTNGLDDPGVYIDGATGFAAAFPEPRLGPDDVGERETLPPYDRPLRSVQVVLRLYERDSRQIRQVRVNQSFVPE